MAGFDDLIQGALEQQGNPTAERREAIYFSSRQALERMLEQNTDLDAAAAQTQRERLEAAILKIEGNYVTPDPEPAAPTTPPPEPTVTPTATPVAPASPVSQPAVEAPRASPKPEPALAPAPMPKPAQPVSPVPPVPPAPPKGQAAPAAATASPVAPAADELQPVTRRPVESPQHLEPEIAGESGVAPGEAYPENYRGNAFRERKPYARLLLWTIILVGVAVAAWWAITFGPAFLKQQFDGSVPNPTSTIESGSFVPNETEGWISAFDPNEDSHNIVSADRGTADLMRSGNVGFVRLASNVGSTRNNLRIKIPKGIMQTLKGRSATFELTIKNSAETVHQFAIFCEFSQMGNCGRKRFKANNKTEAFIFDALINDVTLSGDEEAYLDINTDLSNDGKSIDLFSVRVRAG